MVPTAKEAKGAISVAKGGTSITASATALKQSADQSSKISKVSDSRSCKTTSKNKAQNTTSALNEKVTTPAAQTEKEGIPAQDIIPSADLRTRGATLQPVDSKVAATDIGKSPDTQNTEVDDDNGHGSETITVLSSGQGKQSKATPSKTSEKDPQKSRKYFLQFLRFFLSLPDNHFYQPPF